MGHPSAAVGPQIDRSSMKGSGNAATWGLAGFAGRFGAPTMEVGSWPRGGLRCFACGEAGHRQTTCPRHGISRALLVEADSKGHNEVVPHEHEPGCPHLHIFCQHSGRRHDQNHYRVSRRR
ncbi:gag-pol polyprotein [Striga asiatica]|uniref:Gag-pol polyprotein n=1 Tax=Striga asiatica TaxID=4170 RepID=A0A5A7R6T3_STRAF|nr:gag-pol polyprotein [Striga asiatica]